MRHHSKLVAKTFVKLLTNVKSYDEDSDCGDLENVLCTEFVYENSKNMKKSDFTVSIR
jgi:hypothetical protein